MSEFLHYIFVFNILFIFYLSCSVWKFFADYLVWPWLYFFSSDFFISVFCLFMPDFTSLCLITFWISSLIFFSSKLNFYLQNCSIKIEIHSILTPFFYCRKFCTCQQLGVNLHLFTKIFQEFYFTAFWTNWIRISNWTSVNYVVSPEKVMRELQSMTPKCLSPKCPTFFIFLFYYSPKLVSFG